MGAVSVLEVCRVSEPASVTQKGETVSTVVSIPECAVKVTVSTVVSIPECAVKKAVGTVLPSLKGKKPSKESLAVCLLPDVRLLISWEGLRHFPLAASALNWPSGLLYYSLEISNIGRQSQREKKTIQYND